MKGHERIYYMALYSSLDCSLFKRIICGGADRLKSKTAEINNLNVFPVPDGDTGDNMSLTMNAGVASMNGTESESIGDAASALSRGMLLGARGNSGVILSQFWSGVAKQLEGTNECDATEFAEALSSGVKQAYRSVMSPTEGTILTVAREGVGEAINKLTHESSIESLISDVRSAMYASLKNTPNLLDVLAEAGVVDSGGAGLFYIFDGISRTLSGETITSGSGVSTVPSQTNPSDIYSAFTEDSEMTYGYCTEFLLRLQRSKVDIETFDNNIITDYLSTIGSSIVSVRNGTIVKVHVHTMEPEKVLAFCRRYGEFLTIKIENMSVQHSGLSSVKKAEPLKEYGTVAVCSGDGIKKTFKELGVDCIIDGGQTNNPSTEDFIKAFGSVNARHIFVFPNNSNIILAANQAAQIYKDADIRVVESKDLGSGYVGMASFNPEADTADELYEMISDSMKNVETGNVTKAVRNADIRGVHIECDDYICFIGKSMIASCEQKADALHALIDSMFAQGEKFMLTAFCGNDALPEESEELHSYLKKKYPDIELYMVDGGQEIYSYILIAE